AGAQHTHLSGPYGIDITPNMIAIADSDNNRIQFFDVQGNYLHTLSGAGPVSFVYPCGVKIDETRNRIYVADTYAERVQVFDMERNHIATIRGGDGNYTDNALPTGNLTFKHPYDVNIDSNGMIYVLDTDHQVIQVFDPVTFNHSHSLEGSSWSSFDGFWAGDIRWACGFDMVDDVIYIADTYNHRVKIIDLDGNFLGVVGLNETSGSTNEHFARPRGVGVGNGGMIYVADSDNNRIQVFNPDLSFNTSLSSSGLAVFDNMHFNYPEGVAVDASGNIYVADSNNHRIQAYSSTGNHLFTIGSSTQRASGSDNFHLFNPSSVKIHGNRIYVVDKGNARIQVFSMSGIYERTIGADCYDMAIGPGGNLYVADTPNHCIKVLTSAGQTIQTLGTFMVSGSSNTHLNFPTSVAVDSAGRVYVSDHMNHRIVIYDDISSSIADRIIGDTGIKGSDVNHFDGPKGVAVWSNEIYVADTGNQRVQIFNQAGNYLRTIGVTGKSGRDNVHFRGLVDVFVDVEGTLYVADSDNNRVVKIVNVEGQAFSAEARPLPPSGPSRQGLDPAALPLLLAVPIIIMAGLLLILTRKKPGEHEVEGVSSTPLPAIKTGVTYRVEGENPAKLFSLVDRHLGEGKKAMCISRQSPDSVMDQLSSLAPGKIMDRYEMPMSNIYWISGATSERAIAPGDLNRLLFVVGNFADKNPGSIITMDGIDHISTHVPFEKLIDLVGSLAELAAIKKVSIV
ncbi:MAG: 6-bladed beta-propeller, partial [Candidatus Thermoplasmatota archaeon]|nr:6-bladed beta-propeller [Candidatus Thermoplasmatota archaeon]